MRGTNPISLEQGEIRTLQLLNFYAYPDGAHCRGGGKSSLRGEAEAIQLIMTGLPRGYAARNDDIVCLGSILHINLQNKFFPKERRHVNRRMYYLYLLQNFL